MLHTETYQQKKSRHCLKNNNKTNICLQPAYKIILCTDKKQGVLGRPAVSLLQLDKSNEIMNELLENQPP